MKKPRALTLRRYVAYLIDLNEYLASFPGAILNDKISIIELKKTLLNSMPDSWCKQSYVQGFDYESITFNKAVNMFELMETAESVYEGVEEPSYKKPTRADANRAVQIMKNRGEVA